MEYYLSNKELNESHSYLKYRLERICYRKNKGSILPFGDGVCEDNEEKILAELSHLIEWMKGASDMGFEKVSFVFEKKSWQSRFILSLYRYDRK